MRLFRDTRFLLHLAALALLLVALVIPPVRAIRHVSNLVAVLDITGSMNARDQSLGGSTVSRLAMEKFALRDLLARLPCGSRLGVAIFVEERPFLLFEPMETCANFAALDAAIEGIDWRMGWDSESHIAGGVVAAMAMARDLQADLIFMTDGQEVPPLSWSRPPAYSTVRGAVSGLLVGVGGYDFVAIPKFDGSGREIGVWKPGQVPSETGGLFKGHEHLTAVDEGHLRALGAETGLAYVHLQDRGDLAPALATFVRPRRIATTIDIGFVPAGLAFLLLAVGELGGLMSVYRRLWKFLPNRPGARAVTAASGHAGRAG